MTGGAGEVRGSSGGGVEMIGGEGEREKGELS